VEQEVTKAHAWVMLQKIINNIQQNKEGIYTNKILKRSYFEVYKNNYLRKLRPNK
jgi:hypothetical protein